MSEYHKINSVYKRNEKGKFLLGEYAEPELEYLQDVPWLWTEKIDGTNIRIIFKTDGSVGKFDIGGKTDNAQIPNKLVNYLRPLITRWEEDITEGDDEASTVFTFHDDRTPSEIILYGEGYGAGIQKGGGLYSPEQKFILFDVKIDRWWLRYPDVVDVANKLGIDVVPEGIDYSLSDMIDYVRNEPQPKSSIGMALVEGWVGTPRVPLFNRKGERIITKIKYKDFA